MLPHVTERELLGAAKPALRIHDDAALNAEAAPAMLDHELTPEHAFFVRNNGSLPPRADPAAWRLCVDGEVERVLELSLPELQAQFEIVSIRAVLECAGNGRAGFIIPTDGLQWSLGAVGCAEWTGVRMADVLAAAGVRRNAMYVAHHSPDRATAGAAGPVLSRGVPIAKALAPETLLAFGMNGEPLSFLHGSPLRVVAPGYPGSAWQKWLERISVLDVEHDGMKMTGTDYRLPRSPVALGGSWAEIPFDVITDMPIRAMITSPAPGFVAPANSALPVRGFAWGGHTPPARVEISADGGANWVEAFLDAEQDGAPFAWRRFHAHMAPREPGSLELVARATDLRGRSQPLGSAPWNPRGYCNNGVQRVRGSIENGR